MMMITVKSEIHLVTCIQGTVFILLMSKCQANNAVCILDESDLCYTKDESFEKLRGYTSFLDVYDGDSIVKSPESKSQYNETSRNCTTNRSCHRRPSVLGSPGPSGEML